MREFIAGKNEEGSTVLKFINRIFPKAPNGFAYKMLRKKNIKVNDVKAKADTVINRGDSIKIFISDETFELFGQRTGNNEKNGNGQRTDNSERTGSEKTGNRQRTDNSERTGRGQRTGNSEKTFRHKDHKNDIISMIVYEDENVLFVNKPAGLLSQKARPEDVSLIDIINEYLMEKDPEAVKNGFKAGMCNRLDRNTSGIAAAGISLKGSRLLGTMIAERTVDKYYLALVSGRINEKKLVKAWLSKDESANKVEIKNKDDGKSKLIITEYEPLALGKNATLLKVKLITGRAHQIRAHLSSLGHPVIGDMKYGDVRAGRMMLHAFEMDIKDAGEELGLNGKCIKAMPDEEFIGILSSYGIDRSIINKQKNN